MRDVQVDKNILTVRFERLFFFTYVSALHGLINLMPPTVNFNKNIFTQAKRKKKEKT